MKLDLHIHSTASDGACTPREVVNHAAEAGLDVIALADHDTVDGVGPATTAAEERGLRVVPAIEVSSVRGGKDIHVLGYFVDLENAELQEYSGRASGVRLDRMQEMVSRLNQAGVSVTMTDVLEAAGEGYASVGRPHLAQALVATGAVGSVPEAFDRYIGDGMAAHVPVKILDPTEAIELILRAGGLPVWAHPPLDLLPRYLPGFVRDGLRGIETYRPRSRPETVSLFERQAAKRGLVTTGGSDWHGPDRGLELGRFSVSDEQVAAFLEEGGF